MTSAAEGMPNTEIELLCAALQGTVNHLRAVPAYLTQLGGDADNIERAIRTLRSAESDLARAVQRNAELLGLNESVARFWAKRVARYERCGSDWHNKMPGEWPAEVTLTVQQCRDAYACAYLAGDGGGKNG